MNELARRFCVNFFNIKKVAIFLNSLFFTSIFYFKKAFCVKTPSKKLIDKEIEGCYKCFENR